MGEINAFELPDTPGRMPMLYAHGLMQLRRLGCRCNDPSTSQGCHLVVDLPDGWNFHPGPNWAERYLHDPKRLHITMIRDERHRPRAIIVEEWEEGDEYPLLHHIEVFSRFAIMQNQHEHAFVLDRATEESCIASFAHQGGTNYETACDWLAINYPNWRNPFAYWDD